MEPPQLWIPNASSDTCQGYSSIVAGSPPTIRPSGRCFFSFRAKGFPEEKCELLSLLPFNHLPDTKAVAKTKTKITFNILRL